MRILPVLFRSYIPRLSLRMCYSNTPSLLNANKPTNLSHNNIALIALGSNLGDSIKVMNDSILQMNKLGHVSSTSFLYSSKPKYELNQPSFINSACLLHTDLTANELIKELKRIEDNIGRQKSYVNGPRLIDLDIIFYNNEHIVIPPPSPTATNRNNSSQIYPLTIPHIRMHERAFVLKPIYDIYPTYIHPILNKTVAQLWHELPECEKNEIIQVFPIGKYKDGTRRLLQLTGKQYYICGILNVTPDRYAAVIIMVMIIALTCSMYSCFSHHDIYTTSYNIISYINL